MDRKLASEGDLSTVQGIFDQLRGTPTVDYWIPRQRASLVSAVRNGHTNVVEYLLSQGASPELYIAKIATEKKDKIMLELLIKHGWDINEQYTWCDPPLLGYAVENADLVNWFLSHGADPKARCVLDVTPLSYVVRSASFTTIKTLFNHGGSANKGQLLNFATRRKLADHVQIIGYLINELAPINDIMYQHDLPSTNLEYGIGLGTPLNSAAEAGHLNVIKFLLEKGANPNIVDSRARTILANAEYYKHEVAEFLRSTVMESTHWL